MVNRRARIFSCAYIVCRLPALKNRALNENSYLSSRTISAMAIASRIPLLVIPTIFLCAMTGKFYTIMLNGCMTVKYVTIVLYKIEREVSQEFSITSPSSARTTVHEGGNIQVCVLGKGVSTETTVTITGVPSNATTSAIGM